MTDAGDIAKIERSNGFWMKVFGALMTAGIIALVTANIAQGRDIAVVRVEMAGLRDDVQRIEHGGTLRTAEISVRLSKSEGQIADMRVWQARYEALLESMTDK